MKYKKIMLLAICLVSLLAISAVSAEENATEDIIADVASEDVVSVENNNQTIEQTENEDTIGATDDGTFTALQEKIDNAEEGSTITLENDYKYDDDFGIYGISIRKSLTIDGNGKTIDGNGKSRIFYISWANVVIENLNLCRGDNSAIYNYQSNLTIMNSMITNSASSSYGGAIDSFKGTLSLTNVQFIGNTAERGGAIYGNCEINITNAQFINNTAKGNSYSVDGGAIYSSDGTLALTNVQFIGNTAESGGAVYAIGIINNCTFSNNIAKFGAAISGGGGIINNCKFTNNTAENSVAINAYQNLTITNTEFSDNIGGAISVCHDSHIINCTFTDNLADYAGRVIENGGNLTISEIIFASNTGDVLNYGNLIISKTIFANNTGGAIDNCGNLAITDTKFTNNTIIGCGGAINTKKSNNITIKDTEFNRNAALGDYYDSRQGGAIYANDVSNVNIINVIFDNNIATGDSSAGGAIWIAGDNINIENNTFINNSANQGCAVYLSSVIGEKVVGEEWVDGYEVTDYDRIVYDYSNGVEVGWHHPTHWVEGYYRDIYGDVLVGNDIKISKNIFKNNMAKDIGDAIIDYGTNTKISNNINDALSIYSSTIYVNSTNTSITNNNFTGKISTIKVPDGVVDNSEVSAIFFNTDGNPLANAQVTFKVGDEVYMARTNVNGVATADVDLNAGTYTVTAVNPVNNDQKQFKLTISKNSSALSLVSVQTSGGATITATLTPNSASGNVKFIFAGKIYLQTITNGKATLTLSNLDERSYDISASYDGDDNLKASSNQTLTFTIYPSINVNDVVGTYLNSKVSATFFNANKEPLSSKQVTFKIGDKTYTATTNSKGVAIANIDLGTGTYTVTAINPVNNEQKQFKLVINKANSAINLASTQSNGATTLTATLTPATATGNVVFNVNGEDKSAAIKNGKVTLTLSDLEPGDYSVTASYNGDKNLNASTSNAVTFNVAEVYPILTADPVTKTYGTSTKLVVNLVDSKGNAIANADVSVVIGTVTTPIKTDAKGQATMAINKVPGTYTAAIAYADAQTTAKITVKKATPKLTSKAKTFKKSVKTKKYTVTLKTNTNKVMKNTKVTLKVNGKTYKATTNTKGQATFKITKLTKKGKFTAVVKYAGSKYYNAKTIKPKITVK